MKIEMTETRFSKHPRAEETYTTDSVKTKEVTEDYYRLIISDEVADDYSTMGTLHTTKSCPTKYGDMVCMVTLYHKCPIRETKTVKEFKFI